MLARLALAALCLPFVLTLGCRASGALPPAEPLPVGSWVVVELQGADLDALPRAPELELGNDGSLSGFSGVNRFSGKLDLKALGRGTLVTTPIVTTRMAGYEPAMDAETRFLQLLAEPLEWRRVDGALVLEREGERLARLRSE